MPCVAGLCNSHKFKNCLQHFGSQTLEAHKYFLLYTRFISAADGGAKFNSDTDTYASLLEGCIDLKSLNRVQTQIFVTGLHQNAVLGTKLVRMYTMAGSLESARLVFDKIQQPNVYLWNAMIRGYANTGPREEALVLYYQMQREGIMPDKFTCTEVLKACAGLLALRGGKGVHREVVRSGFDSDVFVGTALVDMYAKCGRVEVARQVFDKMPERNVVSWSAMIAGYVQNGRPEEALRLFCQMQMAGVTPNSATMVSVLPACAHSLAVKWIHAHITRAGFESDVSVGTSLVDMYCKCGSLQIARQVFDKMSERNVVTWSAMIAGYAENGHSNEALRLFHQMQQTEIKPNRVTILSVLPACADLAALQQGKDIHGYIIEEAFESDVSVKTALLVMYARCGDIDVARQLFDETLQRDVILWNAMIVGYAQNGYTSEALMLFRQMQLAGVKPDQSTMVTLLPICARLAALEQGKWMHNYIIINGFQFEVPVENALIDMYAKCGSMKSACWLFNNMPKRDVVSWNAVIAGYVQNGQVKEALAAFHQMQQADVKPNRATIVSVLPACADLAALQQGKCIHDYTIVNGFEPDVSVMTALVAMYTKCGSIEVACRLFDRMPARDVASWNSMIAGYAQNGQADEALALFHQMQLADVKPNRITIVSVLPACADLATLEKGKDIHVYAIKNQFESDVPVGTALVAMYAKCGDVEVARHLFDNMSKRDVVSWNTMIAAYGMHGHGENAISLFSKLQETGVKPDSITFVCVLSACSHSGLLEKGWQYFNCMSLDYHITPRVEHYACMVDLLGRAGHLNEAYDFIKQMPLEPDGGVWGALLGACGIHGNIELGEHVSEYLIQFEPKNAGSYVSLSNIYAAAARWDDVAKVRTMLKGRGLTKIPGCSWIEINNKVHTFLVGDRAHPESESIYAMLESLAWQMVEAGYVPDMGFISNNVELCAA